MLARTIFLLALVITPFAGVLQAEEVALQWNLQPEERFFIEEVVSIDQSIGVEGQTTNQKSKQTTIWQVNVLPAAEEGQTRLSIKLDSIKAEGDAERGDTLFRRMEGATFTVTFSEGMKVTEVLGYVDFVKQVASGDESQQRIFAATLPEATFKKSLTAAFVICPEEAVDEDGKWSNTLSLPMGPFGTMSVERTFTRGEIEETTPSEVPFTIAGTGKYTAPKRSETGLPFEVIKGELEVKALEGAGLFDTKTGRLDSLKSKLTIEGTLTMGVGGQTESVKLSQTQETTLKLSEKRPGQLGR